MAGCVAFDPPRLDGAELGRAAPVQRGWCALAILAIVVRGVEGACCGVAFQRLCTLAVVTDLTHPLSPAERRQLLGGDYDDDE